MKASMIVGGVGVLVLVAAVGCGDNGEPQHVSTPESDGTSGDGTSGDGTSGMVTPAEENTAPSAGEEEAVPSQPAANEDENSASPLDLAPLAPEMSGTAADDENADGENVDGESVDDENVDGENVDGESVDDEAAGGEPDPWITLFNGENLDGWTVSRGGGAGQTAAEIFQVTDGMLHVYKGAVQGSTQPSATIRTNDSYGSYVLQFEYMWGTARFSDRSNTERDAGILFHVFNDLNAVWPDSFEFQMGSSPVGGEWVSGDIFVIGSNPRGQTTSIRSGGNFVFAEPEMGGTRRPIGAPNSYERGRTSAKLDTTGWNAIELTVRGAAEAEYRVNGVVANRVFDMERNAGGGFQPLESGPIALQAEYAELFYRNIRLRELP